MRRNITPDALRLSGSNSRIEEVKLGGFEYAVDISVSASSSVPCQGDKEFMAPELHRNQSHGLQLFMLLRAVICKFSALNREGCGYLVARMYSLCTSFWKSPLLTKK
jgi:hypothetical protein